MKITLSSKTRNTNNFNIRSKYNYVLESSVKNREELDSSRLVIKKDYSRKDQGNRRIENAQRYFWDGGIASNIALRELIQAHKDYWLEIKGKGTKDAYRCPYSRCLGYQGESIPTDHDGVMDRNYDLLLNDKTDYDERVADTVSLHKFCF
jgi:hypothetical protein